MEIFKMSKENYETFGKEWEKEMSRMTKAELIAMLRNALKGAKLKAKDECCKNCINKLRNDLSQCKKCDKRLKEPQEITCTDCGESFVTDVFYCRCPHCNALQILCDFCENQNECEGGFGDTECGFVEEKE
jgi:hypothetical protein